MATVRGRCRRMNVDGLVEMRGILADPAIRPAEVLAPRGAEHDARGLRLAHPLLGRAVAAHLAGREIAQADGSPFGGVPGDGAAQADLEVVGVRTEHQKVEAHANQSTLGPRRGA